MKAQAYSHPIRNANEVVSCVWPISFLEIVALEADQQPERNRSRCRKLTISKKAWTLSSVPDSSMCIDIHDRAAV